jgi:ABC-type dipeptide/oligopeptide/nickel transport system ATPase subunit
MTRWRDRMQCSGGELVRIAIAVAVMIGAGYLLWRFT